MNMIPAATLQNSTIHMSAKAVVRTHAGPERVGGAAIVRPSIGGGA